MTNVLRIEVRELGPLRNASIEIPMRGMILFYGSNISGKTMLGLATTTLLAIHGIAVNHEHLCHILGARDFLDLVSIVMGSDPLDIAESVVIKKVNDREEVVEEPMTLREIWPDLSPWERILRYIGAMMLNNAFSTYYRFKRASLNMDTEIAFGSASIKARGSLPVGVDDENRDRLKNFEIEITGRERLIGLALIDPYNDLWSNQSPFSRFVNKLLSRRDIYMVISKLGFKLGFLYQGFIKALGNSLSLSGYTKPELDLSMDREGIVLRVGNAEVPEDLFSKGLRTLISILLTSLSSAVLSAENFNTLLYLDEPEASLDTVMVYTLPLLLAKIVNQRLSIAISTHREDLVVGLEALKNFEDVEVDVRIYEFRYDEECRGFKPIPVEYDEILERFNIERLRELEKRMIMLREWYREFIKTLRETEFET